MKIGLSKKIILGAAAICLSAAIAAPVNATEPKETQVALVYSYCFTAVGSCEIAGAWYVGTPCRCFIPGGGYANGEVI